MPRAGFPEHLKLHESSSREIDIIGNEHIWVPDSHDDKLWNRFSRKAHSEVIDLEKAYAVAVRINCYRQAKKKLLQILFRSDDPDSIDAPIGDNGSNIEVKQTDISRDALLVWAKESGVNLTHEEIESIFPENEVAEELFDAWVVEQEACEGQPKEMDSNSLQVEHNRIDKESPDTEVRYRFPNNTICRMLLPEPIVRTSLGAMRVIIADINSDSQLLLNEFTSSKITGNAQTRRMLELLDINFWFRILHKALQLNTTS